MESAALSLLLWNHTNAVLVIDRLFQGGIGSRPRDGDVSDAPLTTGVHEKSIHARTKASTSLESACSSSILGGERRPAEAARSRPARPTSRMPMFLRMAEPLSSM